MKRIFKSIIVLIVVLAIGGGGYYWYQQSRDTTTSTSTATKRVVQKKQKKVTPLKQKVKLNVPLIDQMSDPALYNGCEVTSLAMLLQYYGSDVTKNELADAITTVPLNYSNGEHGNPNVGFVGSVSGATPGLGVYNKPIYKLAKKYSSKVVNISGSNFKAVLRALSSGHPVWTITTATFAPVDDFQSWSTPQGKMKVTYSEHSVVITGYNKAKKVIYINNPYGQKNEAVKWSSFKAAYKQMGKQAIYINKTK